MAPMRKLLFAAAVALITHLIAAQTSAPAQVEWLVGTQREAALAKQAPWLPLLDRSTLSIGRYRLPVGSTDAQNPHDRDEVYYVVSGKARFTAANETRDLGVGDLVFVAAKARHHFHDITEDLDLLVMFSTAIPITGGMAAAPAPTQQTPFPENSPRGATRIFYWFGPDSAGQVAIQYGRPAWNGKYAQFLNKPSDRRWRLGENFWTTLDTNMALRIGGVDIPIGLYYMVLQNKPGSDLELVMLDPQQVRRQRLDAYQSSQTSGGRTIPLTRQSASPSATRLSIELKVDAKQSDRATLEIAFGGNLLRADMQMHPHQK